MHTRRVVLPLILAFCALPILAQQAIVSTGTVDAAALQKISPRLISFTDTIDGQPDGALTVTFAIYDDQQATTALWTETQIVQITNGKYTALLGSTSADGLPETIFAADQAHWLAVQANGTEQRHLLVAVPYAMKALEAERFGGLLPSQYVTVAQLQTILQNSAAAPAGSTSGGGTSGPTQTAATTGTAPQPATDFTDNNTSEVLLVTQQGTGYAIHAISAGDAALFGENSSPTGTAFKALSSASTGNTIAILGQASSPTGIAAVFDSLGGGEILSLRSNGVEMASVDNLGNLKAAQITAQNFVGNGYGLTNIGPNAVNAQSGNFPDAIVLRDGTGSFAAGQITAQNFIGNGFGLTNIGPNAVNAQSGNFPDAIVLRDGTGSFAAGEITANNFIGNGFGLTNIGPNAINAQSGNFPGAVVLRDETGSFAAGQISANNFIGNGFGLTNIGPNAINAQSGNFPGAVVIRDPNGDFAAGQITANNFIGNGFGLTNIGPNAINAQSGNFPSTVVVRDTSGNFAASQISATGLIVSGTADFSAASTTVPVKTVLTADMPVTCQASKELLLVTDAFPGQQLFVCNTNGNGWVLLGDGGSAGSSNVSGNTTGPLESITQLGSGAGVTVSSFSGTGLSAASTNGTGLSASSANQVAIQATGNSIGVQASSRAGIGVWAAAQATDSSGTSLLLTNSGSGKLISGGQSNSSFLQFETFGVDTLGNVNFNGALMSAYEPSGYWVPNSLVKLTSSSGVFASATVTMTSPGDRAGAIGIITGTNAGDGFVLVAHGGRQDCVFDGTPQMGDYVGISQLQPGECTDLGPAYPTNGVQVIGRVTLSSGATLGTILLFGPDQHASSTGSFSLSAADSSVLIGGTSVAPTVEVADGGITTNKIAAGAVTSANLAANAVTSANIADGSLSPAKITGTAATLGANTFTGTQTIPAVNAGSLTVSGNISGTGGGSISGSTFINTAAGTALSVFGGDATNPGFTATNPANGGIALEGTSLGNNAIGVLGRANGGQSVAGLFVNTQGNGRIISAGTGPGTFGSEVFSVDTAGNMFAGGALVASFPGSTANTTPSGLAKLDVNGFAVSTAPGDTTGAVGVVLPLGGGTSSVRIAYGGTAFCVFDSAPHIGDYVQISRTTTGECADVGPTFPSSGQVIGRVTGVSFGAGGFVLLSGPSTQAVKSGVATINTGAGLTGGPITSSGTISIANAGVTNTMLQNSSVAVNAGTGLSGGGLVSLGGSVTLNNAGALSFNGRKGNIFSASGDYSFAQLAGTATAAQLPVDVAYNDRSNIFSTDQTIQGNLTATGNITASGSVTANSLSINDSGPANGLGPLSVVSQNNPAASLTSLGPIVFSAGNAVRGLMVLDSSGNLNLGGAVTATAYNGDGSGLTNVNASRIGTLAPTDIATANGLSAETTARQSDVANLQSSLATESSTRAAGDASLQTSISAETAARQSDIANLQTNINNVSAADAKLAASNTFTAGTQDFSGAGATLPVRTVLSANTPATCFAGKELLIKTDAPAGQQLFICDTSGTTWDLVGDGASGGVTSFNGRAGSVTPAANDYSFAQISGSATVAQLPSTVVYNNQANTLAGNQTVNGNVTATAFSGNGTGLSNVNAATLNGIPSNGFAQLNTANTFTAEQMLPASTSASASLNIPAGSTPASPVAGDVWNTGSTLQYRDSSSTTQSLVSTPQSGGFQLLKLTASITPATVNAQLCAEQSFTVAGLNTTDLLLTVAQPATKSPGTNIAIGGWRVSAANTVAIQFCNVSRSNSTPSAGTYTFAVMR